MARAIVDRLEEWKGRFSTADTGRLERLLAAAARRRPRDARETIRLHETLLFLRAYPRSAEVARLADRALFAFADRVRALEAAGQDLSVFEDPEISGIAGTSLCAVFSYEVAQQLAQRYPREVEIAWDRYEEADKLGPVAARFLPLIEEDWPVEAHAPYREWFAAARMRGISDLVWLLDRLVKLPIPPRERAEIYDALDLPVTWRVGNARVSRSRLRLPARKLYVHSEPLLRRGDITLSTELAGPRIPVRRLPRAESRRILADIMDTSAIRFRQLYGFSHPDERGVFHADAGRGVEVYFFGVPPERRLPLRAYHAGMFCKNGVPAGYVELLSFFERAEVGFNLYFTFREGESAWLYGRLLHLFRQALGVNCFSVDPYQLGHENPEAVDSGAFWFYRKLGFRPVGVEAARLVEREEHRIRESPGYRSSRRTLEKLAEGYLLFEGPGAETGAWDGFRIRHLGQAAARAMAERFGGDVEKFRRHASLQAKRNLGIASGCGLAQILSLVPEVKDWTTDEKRAAAEIIEAKERGAESRFLRLMQGHRRMRDALLRLGSPKASRLARGGAGRFQRQPAHLEPAL